MRNIVRLVDTCTRYSIAIEIPNEEDTTLLNSISVHWVTIFSPMTTLTLDEESGLRGRAVIDWAESN